MEEVTMKRKSLFVVTLVLIVGLALSSGMSLFAHSGDYEFEDEQSTVSGTVSFKRPGGYFLQTDAGEEYKLAMGPIWHLDNMGLELKSKDRITVTGFKGEDEIILVTSVDKDGKTFQLAEAGDPDEFCPGGRYGMGPGMTRDRGYYGHHHPLMREGRGFFGRRGGRGRGCW
jgi:hypothetical protein